MSGEPTRIESYTSNRETKEFIVERARMMAPDVREKSGVWYRLNRWRVTIVPAMVIAIEKVSDLLPIFIPVKNSDILDAPKGGINGICS